MERAGEINFFKKCVRYKFEGVLFLVAGDIQTYINVDGNEWSELEGVMERRHRGGQVAAGGKSPRRQGGGQHQSTGGGINLRGEEGCLHLARRKAGKNSIGCVLCPLIFTKLYGARCCFPQFSSGVMEAWKSQVICPESHWRTQVFQPQCCFELQLSYSLACDILKAEVPHWKCPDDD